MEKLTAQHYEDIEFLMNISGHILKQYEKLIALENNGQNDNIEGIVEDIKSSKEIEKSIISRLCSDESIIPSLLKYFRYNSKINSIEDSSLLSDRELDLIYSRLANKICIIEIDKANYIETDDMIIQDSIDKSKELGDYIHLDLINTVLILLNNYLKEHKDYNLIAIKYRIMFTHDLLENMMLENNFNIGDSLYWMSSFYADLIGFDSKCLSDLKAVIGLSLFSSQLNIYTIISLFNNYKAVYSKILIRASLLFLSEKDMEFLKKKIAELNGVAKSLEDDTDLFALLDDYEKDRELPQIIRTRYRRKNNE